MADVNDLGTEDAFHEIHLSGKQLVFLFMATTVVSVVIFLCGVLVGRGVRAQQASDPLTDPTPAASASSAPAQATPETGPQATEPPAPPAEADELSYKKRLEGEAPAESLKPSSAPPARTAATTPPPAEPAPQPTSGSTVQPGTWVVQVHALRDRRVADGIVQRLVKKGYPAVLVAGDAPAGIYRVQVGRYKDRDDAVKAVERLKKEEQFNPWITR